MATTDVRRPGRGLGAALVRSWVLWACAVVALVASPALFLSTLVGGAALAVVGVAVRRARGTTAVLAAGLGLVLGSLPYAVLALGVLVGLR